MYTRARLSPAMGVRKPGAIQRIHSGRSKNPLSRSRRFPVAEKVNPETWVCLLKQAVLTIGGAEQWHWFTYHFSKLPPHPMARSVIDASAECEKQIPGLGFQFIQDIASICGKEKHEPHYEQLLQKLSEVLVLRQLLNLEWPEGTTFQHEPAASATGKRPELRVVTPERGFLFEVKTPSLLEHTRARRINAILDFPPTGGHKWVVDCTP
jgi:hypothetical protein